MINHKETVLLTEAQETLLVPLYSKALESRRPRPIIQDEKAQEILERVDYDFARLEVPRKTAVTLCIRARKLDDYAREFLARAPQSVVLHLGCGLDSRCQRVDNGQVEWYDLDMPDVIDLRRKFYQETDSYHLIPSSVTELAWVDSIMPQGRPVLVIAEGLLMYLREADVQALVRRLLAAFPGSDMAFDAYSTLTAKNAQKHPSIKKTGASIHWGIDDATAVAQWGEGIQLVEEWYFTQSDALDALGWGYRLAFKLAGLFPAANKAHRLLYYRLG
ncbi:MAG: class I SAM-dependent methyltransferase [Anaerolineales bacterium]|nr:class I SAM-dependent methyltransferase [Anaerolineales bacterium]